MYALDDSPLFSFDGKHCEDMNVAFLPSQYPFIAGQNVPSLTVAGRHGSLRYPGRTFKPKYYKGTLYWMNDDGGCDPITTKDMLQRATDIAAWLCGKDGRGQLILDALDDRYYIAELAEESALSDVDWMSGQAAITFTCQPFARAMKESSATIETAAQPAKNAALTLVGNMETLLAFSVTNTSSSTMNTLLIEAPDTTFEFESLALASGETLHGSYTDDDILLLKIEGVDGAHRSAMAMRTTGSDDDLLLYPGRNEITVKTQTACSVTFAARGRWM